MLPVGTIKFADTDHNIWLVLNSHDKIASKQFFGEEKEATAVDTFSVQQQYIYILLHRHLLTVTLTCLFQWSYPTKAVVGMYRCIANGMDKGGHTVSASASAVISNVE